jgi:hypothetical protein
MGTKKRPKSRELADFHAVFDQLGVEKGLAAERVLHWYRRKTALFRANGHPESCQCHQCGEARIVEKFMMELRSPYSDNGSDL